MSIETFEKKEAILNLKEKLLLAEEQRLNGTKTTPLHVAHQQLREKLNGKR